MKKLKVNIFIILIFLFSTAGCSPISNSLRRAANRDLTVPLVKNNSQNYIGSTVIWGGIIIKTTNTQEGAEIIILNTQLKGQDKPRSEMYSKGRFIALADEFLDPIVYKEGRRVTIAGEITGVETRALDSVQYAYPIVNVKELYLWQKEIYVYDYYGYDYGYYHYPRVYWRGDFFYRMR